MRHDYDLPQNWDAMDPEERDQWFKNERARRQARTQETATARHLEKANERLDRRHSARSETVSLSDYR